MGVGVNVLVFVKVGVVIGVRGSEQALVFQTQLPVGLVVKT